MAQLTARHPVCHLAARLARPVLFGITSEPASNVSMTFTCARKMSLPVSMIRPLLLVGCLFSELAHRCGILPLSLCLTRRMMRGTFLLLFRATGEEAVNLFVPILIVLPEQNRKNKKGLNLTLKGSMAAHRRPST